VTKKISKTKHVDDLRRRAEKRITESTDSIGTMSAPEIQKLVHELHVHQIELEMQKEALQRSQAEAADERRKYTDLYDFAPVGYFTLDKKGRIIEANVTGASLLGAEKRSLAKQPFQRFIVHGYFSIFQSHLQKAHETQSKQICKLKLTGKDGAQFDALIDTIAVIDGEGKFDHYRSSVTDITEITRAEEALKENEANVLNILDKLLDVLFATDDSGFITFISRLALQVFGWKPEEMVGRNFIEFLPDAEIPGVVAQFQGAMASGQLIKNLPFIMKRKDESTFPVELSSSVISKDGRTAGTIGIIRDITERKLMEEALRLTGENFRYSLEESPLGVRIVTIDGETLFANRAILDIYGYDSIEELKTTPIKNRYTPQSYAEFKIRKEKRKRGDNAPSEYEISIVRTNGEIRHIQVFRKEVLWDGERQFQVLYNDITDRKRAEAALRESEERFRIAINATKDGLWEWDIQTNQEFFSPRWCEIIGYSFDDPRLPHTYDSWASRIHPDDYNRVMSALNNHFETGVKYDVDYRHRHKSGEYRWQNSRGQAVLDERGKPTKMVGCISDITERKRAEEALKKRERDLKAKSRKLEELNTALKVLLKQREDDKDELEKKVLVNVKQLAMPYIERLKKSRLKDKEADYVNILESNLTNIISPFSNKLSSKYINLTPKEIQIANLIKEGKTTKDIANLLNISPGTVEYHRENIRRKLNLKNKKGNMRSYLLTLS